MESERVGSVPNWDREVRVRATKVIGVIALGLIASSAWGRAPEQSSPLIDGILQCAADKDPIARLACYDRTAAALAAANSKGDVVVVDREDVRKTRRALFGFSAVHIPFFKGDRSLEEVPAELVTKIKSVKSDGYDKFYLTLADGGTWKTTEPARFDPRPGDPIKIKHTMFGAFMIDGGRLAGVKVIRLG